MTLLVKRAIYAIFFYTLAVILIAQAGMAYYAWSLFGESLMPELEHKTEAIALSLGGKLSKALNRGIPFTALEGAEDFFSEVLNSNRDIAFIALASPDGTIAHAAGYPTDKIARALAIAQKRDSSPPARAFWADLSVADQPGISQIVSVRLQQGEAALSPGTLHVGVQRDFLDDKVSEIQIDIFVVLSISLLVVFESMRFIITTHLLAPLAQVDEQLERLLRRDFSSLVSGSGYLDRVAALLNSYVLSVHTASSELLRRAGNRRDEILCALNARFVLAVNEPEARTFRPVTQIRLITFLFMFGEQLSRPFLPVFARSLMAEGSTGTHLWAGLPISAFMLAVALSMPVLTAWSERVGRRRSFLWGAIGAATGLLGSSFCLGIGDFIFWRAVTGIAYASMFVACQGFVLDNTHETDRARGIATFVGAIMVSELCAPGIGGILSDRMGERAVFAIGAGVMLLAALIASSVLNRPSKPVPSLPKEPPRLLFQALGNPRFVALLLAAAIPAKFALTAFMFYIVPIGLASMEISQAEIGRVAMLYAIPSVLAASLFARFADRMGWSGLMVGLGGMMSGAGFLPLLFWPNEAAVVIGVLALGLGQAMSISSQLSLVTQTCREEISRYGAGGVLGIYRLAERAGAALGPIVAGGLTAQLGPMEAAGVLGMLTFLCAVVFSVVFLVLGVRQEKALFPPDAGQREIPA